MAVGGTGVAVGIGMGVAVGIVLGVAVGLGVGVGVGSSSPPQALITKAAITNPIEPTRKGLMAPFT